MSKTKIRDMKYFMTKKPEERKTKANYNRFKSQFGFKSLVEIYEKIEIDALYYISADLKKKLKGYGIKTIHDIYKLSEHEAYETEYNQILYDLTMYDIVDINMIESDKDVTMTNSGRQYLADAVVRSKYYKSVIKNKNLDKCGFVYDKVVELYSKIFNTDIVNIDTKDKDGNIPHITIPEEYIESLIYTIEKIKDNDKKVQLYSFLVGGPETDIRGSDNDNILDEFDSLDTYYILLNGVTHFSNRMNYPIDVHYESNIQQIVDHFEFETIEDLYRSIDVYHIFGNSNVASCNMPEVLKNCCSCENLYDIMNSSVKMFQRNTTSKQFKEIIRTLDRIGIYSIDIWSSKNKKNGYKWHIDSLYDYRKRLIAFMTMIQRLEGGFRYDKINKNKNILEDGYRSLEAGFLSNNDYAIYEIDIDALDVSNDVKLKCHELELNYLKDFIKIFPGDLMIHFDYNDFIDLLMELGSFGVYLVQNRNVSMTNIGGIACVGYNGYWIPYKVERLNDRLYELLRAQLMSNIITIEQFFSFLDLDIKDYTMKKTRYKNLLTSAYSWSYELDSKKVKDRIKEYYFNDEDFINKIMG